jgi:hypothetical protein
MSREERYYKKQANTNKTQWNAMCIVEMASLYSLTFNSSHKSLVVSLIACELRHWPVSVLRDNIESMFDFELDN